MVRVKSGVTRVKVSRVRVSRVSITILGLGLELALGLWFGLGGMSGRGNVQGEKCSTLIAFLLTSNVGAVKPRPHQQQCRTKFRPFDKVETNWTCSICFAFVERTKFYNSIVRQCCRLWKQSRTLLRHCCWCGRGFTAEAYFLSLQSGFSPLHIAAHYGNVSIARLLIQHGADVNRVGDKVIRAVYGHFVNCFVNSGPVLAKCLTLVAFLQAHLRRGRRFNSKLNWTITHLLPQNMT